MKQKSLLNNLAPLHRFDRRRATSEASRAARFEKLFGSDQLGRTQAEKQADHARAFNGHMPSDTLKDVLRISHHSGRAKFVKEPTKGAPSEQRFCTVNNYAH